MLLGTRLPGIFTINVLLQQSCFFLSLTPHLESQLRYTLQLPCQQDHSFVHRTCNTLWLFHSGEFVGVKLASTL